VSVVRHTLIAFCAAAALVGCATREVHVVAPFDAALTEQMLRLGPNTITGSALVRRRNGNVVTCAGREVFLIPGTPYATERIGHIYGAGHFIPFGTRSIVRPDPPEYRALTRRTVCNAAGFFRFENIADGHYFVHTVVSWDGGSLYPEGGSLVSRAKVQGGQSAEVVLAP
jgi:hypothetical protein